VSHHTDFRHSHITEPAKVMPKPTNISVATGTCTYISRTASPWFSSAGLSTRANHSRRATPMRMVMPSTRVPREPVVTGAGWFTIPP
jgi:hypothetical protein